MILQSHTISFLILQTPDCDIDEFDDGGYTTVGALSNTKQQKNNTNGKAVAIEMSPAS